MKTIIFRINLMLVSMFIGLNLFAQKTDFKN